jgi:hypothetical protein
VKTIAWEPVVAGMILGGMLLYWMSLPKPADATEYQQRIRDAAATVSMHIGNWSGKDVPVPQAAVRMLKPNVIMSRRYLNLATGLDAQLLLVQCGDARDLVAHYPPVCMVNSGWTLVDSQPRDWSLANLRITGMEYRFEMKLPDRSEAVTVDDFMLLPDGRLARDMNAIDQAADDVTRRYFGAGQIQMLTSSDISSTDRDQAFVDLLGGMRPEINAILGATH